MRKGEKRKKRGKEGGGKRGKERRKEGKDFVNRVRMQCIPDGICGTANSRRSRKLKLFRNPKTK